MSAAAVLSSADGRSFGLVGTSSGEESPEPAAGGRASFPPDDAVAVEVAFGRGGTALRIGLRTSTVAVGASGGTGALTTPWRTLRTWTRTCYSYSCLSRLEGELSVPE
jgi:hypothetical protein